MNDATLHTVMARDREIERLKLELKILSQRYSRADGIIKAALKWREDPIHTNDLIEALMQYEEGKDLVR